MDIKVLGAGCRNCSTTAELITKKANELGVTITLDKISDYPEIIRYGVMSTPGIVIDGKLVHSGGVPHMAAIERWLKGT
jgi:small redox-active disulfide protein 2